MIVAYIRVSVTSQHVGRQKYLIQKYAKANDVKIDKYYIMKISSRESLKKRKIEELLLELGDGDTLICTELTRLGRTMIESLNIVEQFYRKGVSVIFTTQNHLSIYKGTELKSINYLQLAIAAYAGHDHREDHSEKTKAALAARKAAGVILGKPVGTIQPSMYDGDKNRILKLLKQGNSIYRISKLLRYGSEGSLRNYLYKRGYAKPKKTKKE
uniref:Site-specific recombinase, resolvase family n=1 Tax=Francisella tularensis subsp. novicida PA10-7858 TaxID=1386968 RepID=V5TAD9_FRANO|nr:recombinase family protein [Francisella tularensis]AHB60769.1 Site-specific recombinase, resolvase family [Francisella tularensis subsp. novicida PA10-7858]